MLSTSNFAGIEKLFWICSLSHQHKLHYLYTNQMTYIKLAFRNIFRNRLRTIITASAVFFAVIFCMLMRSVQHGTYENMIKNVVGFYNGYLKVNQAGFWQEKSLENTLLDNPELRSQLQNNSNIKTIVPRLESFALAAAGDLTKGVIVTGVDPQAEKNVVDIEAKIKEGNYFKANDNAVIITDGLAEFLKLGVGDTLILLSQGYQAISASGKYPIAATMRLGVPDLNNSMVFMPLKACQYFYGAEDRLSSIIPVVNNVNRLDKTVTSLQKQLPQKYEVLSWQKMLPELIQLIQADNAGGLVMLFILYTIIGFGIFGTILMMTTERIYEFGVLISVGMKRWKLIIVVLLESLFINFLGVIAGMLAGIPILGYFYHNPIKLKGDLDDFAEQYNIEPVLNFSLDPAVFYWQGIIVFIIALIVSIYPIYRISRLNLISALRG